MTRKELIEREACKYGNIDYPMPYGYVGSANDYSNSINSQLAKDLTELAVIEGKIEAYNDVMDNLLNKEDLISNAELRFHIVELETTRTELLTKLNLEG